MCMFSQSFLWRHLHDLSIGLFIYVMEDVDYDGDLNRDDLLDHQPLTVTVEFFKYHLYRDESNTLQWSKDVDGRHIISPRNLMDICIHKTVADPHLLYKVKSYDLPGSLYPQLLTEAIFCNEIYAIVLLVSTWPRSVLNVLDAVPVEESLYRTDWDNYLTSALDGKSSMCLLDCFILGLLNLQTSAKLQVIDFSGFAKDRKLCRELMRLPILWLPLEKRTTENIHSMLLETCEISKDKVERYLNRISLIYSNFAAEFAHGKKIEPVTVLLNCDISLDDMPIGLALQHYTPFRYAAYRVWTEEINEVILPYRQIKRVLDPGIITHFEVHRKSPVCTLGELYTILHCLESLTCIHTLSLPNVIDCNILPAGVHKVNQSLIRMRTLQKLNFSHCNLRLYLKDLLHGLRQPFAMINLRDCRLATEDLLYLLQWRPLVSLRDINLSHNNLREDENTCLTILRQAKNLVCFSVSYCSLSVGNIIHIAKHSERYSNLKMLCVQSFTPPPQNDIHDILFHCALIPSLQKCVLLPDAYAFPGSNDEDRMYNRDVLELFCINYLEQKGRADIQIE